MVYKPHPKVFQMMPLESYFCGVEIHLFFAVVADDVGDSRNNRLTKCPYYFHLTW